ncbi:hypothetical protein NE237_012535 [Protea cynaroides]|uniref:DUF659 domain-containing protein n=1 Tax=Protea cynaroides TaxID=273540 RepID=A0A9Q0H186_9MAGN|nr:hypothetical protein NE237_012535 [Protea cynaroides]
MVDDVPECGVGYKAPSYDKLKSSLLEKVKGEINDNYKKLRDELKEMGCTILSDCWSYGETKSLVIFSVTCPKGTLFLKSVDVSGHVDNPQYLFELIESVVLEVGLEHVVQVIADSAASYIYAGRLLTSRYPSLFWSTCASYCIDKMLEDINKFCKCAHEAVSVLEPLVKEIDLKMRIGFQDVMVKMLLEEKDKIELTRERSMYTNSLGALGSEFAVMGRTLNSPGDWLWL